MNLNLENYLNGKWIAGTGETVNSCNPATGEVVASARSASKAEIDLAVRSARQAFPSWAGLSFEARRKLIEEFGQNLNEIQNELAEVISQETGKPLWDANNEVKAMISKIPISIEAYRCRCPETTLSLPQGKLITRHKPHGILAVIGPFNFPGHLPNGHIVPALLAGNTVIYKPSELTPKVADLMTKCWEKTELPPGVFNLVHGGKDTGSFLSFHTGIDGLLFTGSWKTGKTLSEHFGSHPEKIIALEMGGNNPLVVSQVSDIQTAVHHTIHSAYLSSGQRCTCARRLILIETSASEAYLNALIERIASLTVGPYTDVPEPFMGPVIHVKAAENLLNVQTALIKQGGTPLAEMRLLKEGTAFLSPGLIDATRIKERPDEEIFGPFLQLVRVRSLQEAIEEANRTQYGLAAGLLADDQAECDIFFQQIRAGVVNWNTQLTGASSAAPFGGIGKSGNHRPSAFYAADYCSYPVASLVPRGGS